MATRSGIHKELAEHWMVGFASSERPLVTVFMDVIAPARGGPWPPLLLFHGWHQNLTDTRARAQELALKGFCVLNLNLRGRCGTVGEPDANGWEVRDAVDAVNAARSLYPQICAEDLPPRAFGASGGGGNVLALIGKMPDFVSAAVSWCGVSDYARWFDWNEQGNYRDEMMKWIGPNPRDAAEAFKSRSGVTVAPNRICPVKLVHGRNDDSVPFEHSKIYQAIPSAQEAPLPIFQELPEIGHDIPHDPYLSDAAAFLLENNKPVYLPQRGRWIVAGFLKTRYFEVRWDHVSLVGSLDVDLRRRRATLECLNSGAAQLRLAGPIQDAELVDPCDNTCRILSIRQQAGWSVVDIQTNRQACGIRWKV